MIIPNDNSKVRFIKKLQNHKLVTLISEIRENSELHLWRDTGPFYFYRFDLSQILK